MNEQQALEQWLYASRCAPFGSAGRAEVEQLVHASRIRNGKLTVTGALLFTGGFFAQYLEGPPDSIAVLKACISRDNRHGDVRTIATGSVEVRKYADWSLAYAGVAGPFDRLLAIAHRRSDSGAQLLLMEMIRRFMAGESFSREEERMAE